MSSGSVACLFCRIVRGDEMSSRVYEDETVLAFMDLYPVNPGHVLVVPKGHAVRQTVADRVVDHWFRELDIHGDRRV